MSSFARYAAALTLSAACTASAAAQPTAYPLERIAERNGYVYAWLANEGAVALTRPGVSIILYAGQTLYRVGDRMIAADRAPFYDGRDLVVSEAVEKELVAIARAHPLSPPPPPTPASAVSASGALAIEARQVPGKDAVSVRGRGPADVPVTILLTGEVSRDLPVVVLSRTAAHTAADGSFAVSVGLTAAPPRGTVVVATATSLPGIKAARARVTLAEPSPAVDSPLDRLPQ